MTTPPPSLDGSGEHVLDNFVWHALGSTHQPFARSLGRARAYQPDITGFAGIEHDTASAWDDLRQLVGPGRTVMLARPHMPRSPDGWTRIGGGFGHQMVLDRLATAPSPAPGADATIEPLATVHVPQMIELVELTKPGPFRPGTIELGGYVGVFVDGRLVAMAGQRVQTAEYTEISAVCTHPSVRGRGLAAALTHRVATSIIERGQTPVLHVAHTNVGAERVYGRLGFVVRGDIEFVAFQSDPESAEAVRPERAMP